MRLIDADAAKLEDIICGWSCQTDLWCVEEWLKEQPTVDAVEVVHGQWIRLDAHKGIEQFKCSICRSECYVPTCMNEPMYGYCPNCGAKMDGDGNA